VDFESIRRADDQLRSLGRELRVARILAGKTQADVARLIGSSDAQVCRIERAGVPKVSFAQLVRFGGAVGLRVWMRAYPGGRRLLDAPQLALLTRFRVRTSAWSCQTEVTMPIQGDLRAADAVLRHGTCTIVVEAITRLADFQAQSRSALAKKRDLGADRLVLLIANTRTNRRALQEAGGIAAESFPLTTDAVMRSLEAGEDPGADGIVLL
jgi:transcriptional regulator with XRE-family HTH domain